ncbi:TetR/AcrR family transcriptional regulator [Mucilaginibacter sp. SMC90]|uniref:TetR/AcrR family transcriptional regulator n=1 Tax=Mucilaginibacter sp. SMC90 TaxID=2929803 RepID=UPI001FB235C6|nr:TetR/AcrR family transcriptional regulator [Mucilaginibacter sp. SMC90]UOE47442.1 TetR/AcrR family transcriptional regulator [Mucilaginibacter sp. SMC90]
MEKIAEISTEEKIKKAAEKVFLRKGFAASTTREIADEADINNALVNYYYRTKEKLFEVVMAEQVATLFGKIFPIVNDPDTSLGQKIEQLVDYYTSVLLEQPGLTLFVMSEIHNRPEKLGELFKTQHGMTKAVIAKQMQEVMPDLNPVQLIMTVMGMILFPHMSRSMFQRSTDMDDKAFSELLNERRQLLPVLIKRMLGI